MPAGALWERASEGPEPLRPERHAVRWRRDRAARGMVFAHRHKEPVSMDTTPNLDSQAVAHTALLCASRGPDSESCSQSGPWQSHHLPRWQDSGQDGSQTVRRVLGRGHAGARQKEREKPWVSSTYLRKTHYFPRILRAAVIANKSIALKDLQELVNQSWEYNQVSYSGKEGNETETSDARA